MSSAPGAPVGSVLRAAREAGGLTIADVAERTNIAGALIGKIEHDDFSDCGGDFFARGHLRLIATTVGIDPAPVIEHFDAVHGVPEPPPPWERRSQRRSQPPQPVIDSAAPTGIDDLLRPRPGGNPVRPPASVARAGSARTGSARVRSGPDLKVPLIVAAAIVAVGLIVFLIASLRGSDSRVAAPPPEPAPASPTVSASPSPPAGIELQLHVVAGQSSSVRVTSGAGQVLFQGVLSANTVKGFSDPKKIVVDYANAKAFTVVLNGKNLGPPSCGATHCILQYEPA